MYEPKGFLWNLEVDDRKRRLEELFDEQNQALQEQNRSLNAFLNNLPGGVICCDYTEHLNLVQYSEGFLSMFGYENGDLERLYQCRFAPMIHPDDMADTLQSVAEQLKRGAAKEIRYRVLCKDGSYVWVLDRGQLVKLEDGRELFYCILIDITETKRAQEELSLSLERHKIIMNQTNDIMFEWDIQTDGLIFSSNWDKKFGYPAPKVSARIDAGKSHIHPDDAAQFLALRDETRKGRAYGESEFRLSDAAGRFIWCRVRVTLQLDREGNPAKAIGVILDIDSKKRRTEQLQELAERDALTGLYNKGAAQRLTERCLGAMQPGDCCAYLIVDVDNFKQVNDLYGHLSGDVLLSDIAGMLKGLFRESDVIGRIGGDEFGVLMRSVASLGCVQRKAGEIIKGMGGLLDGRQGLALSCSIGIAMIDGPGSGFHQIYRRADIALYRAKTQGKNGFCVYAPDMSGYGPAGGGRQGTFTGAIIDSDQSMASLDGRLAAYVFHELYQAQCLKTAIPRVLEIVGRQFKASRAYIFEHSPDNAYTINTFEWCDKGIEPQQENLQRVLVGELEDYHENFQNGIFFCRDVSTLPQPHRGALEVQGIRSMLQCEIRDNGPVRGFVGFDECRGHRLWTQFQISSLGMVAEIIGTFLFKQRARESAGNNQ